MEHILEHNIHFNGMLAASMFSVIKKKKQIFKVYIDIKTSLWRTACAVTDKKKKNKNKELIKQIVSVSIVYFLHVSYFYQ